MNFGVNQEFDKQCLESIKNEILRLTADKPGRIFLFGSRARNEAKRGSDIDIGVEGMNSKDFNALHMDLDLFWESSAVPFHIDLVNFNSVREEFKTIALKDVRVWKES